MEHIMPQSYPLWAFGADDTGGPVIGWHKRMDDRGDEIWVPIVVSNLKPGFADDVNAAKERHDIVRFNVPTPGSVR